MLCTGSFQNRNELLSLMSRCPTVHISDVRVYATGTRNVTTLCRLTLTDDDNGQVQNDTYGKI